MSKHDRFCSDALQRSRRDRGRRARLVAGACLLLLACALTGSAHGGIALVQKGTLQTGSGTSITPTLPAGTTAGDLLVAVVMDVNGGCASDTWTAPAGWSMAVQTCRGSGSAPGPVEIWYKPNVAGGITSVAFSTGSNGANTVAQLSEWSGVATTSPLDRTGTSNTGSSSTTLSVTTSGTVTAAGELAISAFETSSGLSSFTPGTGWAAVRSAPGNGFDNDYLIGPSSGSTLSESVTSSPQTTWGGVIATFLSAACSGGSLTLETSPTATFPGVTLDGYDTSSTVSVAFTLDDETGTGSGWNLNATSTTLSATGGKTLPTSATTVTAASASAATGNCSLPSNATGYPVTLPAAASPPTAAVLYDSASGSGKGPATVTLTAKVAIPGNAKSGAYSSTWTLTLASGP